MEFQDFPRILGKSGKYEIHPPKLCASLPVPALRAFLGKETNSNIGEGAAAALDSIAAHGADVAGYLSKTPNFLAECEFLLAENLFPLFASKFPFQMACRNFEICIEFMRSSFATAKIELPNAKALAFLQADFMHPLSVLFQVARLRGPGR